MSDLGRTTSVSTCCFSNFSPKKKTRVFELDKLRKRKILSVGGEPGKANREYLICPIERKKPGRTTPSSGHLTVRNS